MTTTKTTLTMDEGLWEWARVYAVQNKTTSTAVLNLGLLIVRAGLEGGHIADEDLSKETVDKIISGEIEFTWKVA